jgi:GNAT superfamily N-acetyltransferase
MSGMLSEIRILSSRKDVRPFVEEVIACADNHKNEFGFLPAQVFHEYANRECLFVAVNTTDYQTTNYTGHLLFDCRFPKAYVLQIFVRQNYRKRGVAKILLDYLKASLAEQNFIIIRARVAEDLVEANQFWERQEFYVQAEKRGGTTRNRMILVRNYELETPQLFPRKGQNAENPLKLDFGSIDERPLFLLDLNVLFDLGPRRARNKEIVNLFMAKQYGVCSLAISTEIIEELKRTAKDKRSDPMQDVARILPTFDIVDEDAFGALLHELAVLVFPQNASGNLTDNQRSDLRHLATVVQNKLAGLITSDGAILNAAMNIERKYNIQVLSPSVFSSVQNFYAREEVFETTDLQTVTLAIVNNTQREAVRNLLAGLDVSVASIANEWASSANDDYSAMRYGAWLDRELVGYVIWPSWAGSDSILARIAVNESVHHPQAIATILLKELLAQQSESNVVQFSIEMPLKQPSVHEAAWRLGFRGSLQDRKLLKVALRSIVTNQNWQECREQLLKVSQLKFQENPPIFRTVNQHVPITTPDGNHSFITIESLETLLAPTLFCLSRRSAVITPIRKYYAEQLLGHSRQKSLLPHSKSTTYTEQHYLSNPKTLKHFKRGTIIFFYESEKQQGTGSIIALARVKRAYLKKNIESFDLDPSVLDASTLLKIGVSEIKTITTFDNVTMLPTPVSRKILKQIGCGEPHDLISTHPIDDVQVAKILEVGFAHG